MSNPVNLRRVVRAMNEHRDTYAAPAWAFVQCHLSLNSRRKFTVFDDASVQIGRERIQRCDVPLVSEALAVLAKEMS